MKESRERRGGCFSLAGVWSVNASLWLCSDRFPVLSASTHRFIFCLFACCGCRLCGGQQYLTSLMSKPIQSLLEQFHKEKEVRKMRKFGSHCSFLWFARSLFSRVHSLIPCHFSFLQFDPEAHTHSVAAVAESISLSVSLAVDRFPSLCAAAVHKLAG